MWAESFLKWSVFVCWQLVLVGDQSWLGPVIMSKKGAHAGHAQSLFEQYLVWNFLQGTINHVYEAF
jgi:hypothetical protein